MKYSPYDSEDPQSLYSLVGVRKEVSYPDKQWCQSHASY